MSEKVGRPEPEYRPAPEYRGKWSRPPLPVGATVRHIGGPSCHDIKAGDVGVVVDAYWAQLPLYPASLVLVRLMDGRLLSWASAYGWEVEEQERREKWQCGPGFGCVRPIVKASDTMDCTYLNDAE